MTLFWIALAGCVHPAPIASAEPQTALVFATVLDAFDDAEVTVLPKPVMELLTDELQRRNITLVDADPSLTATFAERRSTDTRISWLAADPEHPALLVECAPRFSAQVSGRYRWSVEVALSVTGLPTRSFAVPVHLLYAHEDEDEAAVDAATVIAARLGRTLDDWIASRKLPPPK